MCAFFTSWGEVKLQQQYDRVAEFGFNLEFRGRTGLLAGHAPANFISAIETNQLHPNFQL
jgi:hypothetical protein